MAYWKGGERERGVSEGRGGHGGGEREGFGGERVCFNLF